MKWLSVTKAKYRRVIFKSKLHLLKAPLDFAIHCNIYGTYTIGRVTSHILERKCGFRTQGLSFLYARGKHFSCYSTQVNAHNHGIKYFWRAHSWAFWIELGLFSELYFMSPTCLKNWCLLLSCAFFPDTPDVYAISALKHQRHTKHSVLSLPTIPCKHH